MLELRMGEGEEFEMTLEEWRAFAGRASFSEMAVPYGDTARGWNWRCAFDVGEYGVGKSAGSIEARLDAPENALLLDAVFANDLGRPVISKEVIGIYERDGGLLWKHRETGGDQTNNESRRGRELVIFSIAPCR